MITHGMINTCISWFHQGQLNEIKIQQIDMVQRHIKMWWRTSISALRGQKLSSSIDSVNCPNCIRRSIDGPL